MNSSKKITLNTKHISAFVYALPALFFGICYFLMSVTGEDIFQYAATGVNPIPRMITAFRYNARLSDIYAWGVIPSFDYLYSFGIDTIFRLIDVALGVGIIYLLSHIALQKRPGLTLGDSIVFIAVFCILLLSKWGEFFYVAFSHIHNYLIIGFFTLMFLLPYSKMILGQKIISNKKTRFIYALIGFLFGFSNNLTPIAFLITLFFFLGINAVYVKFNIPWKKWLMSWQAFSVYGILVSMVIMYLFGTGFSKYINPSYIQLTDYISLSDIIASPAKSISALFIHIQKNIGTMAPCFIPMIVALSIELFVYFGNKQQKDDKALMLSVISLVFVVVHILIMSQICVSPLLRLTVPAYLVGVASFTFTFVRILKSVKIYKVIKFVFCTGLIVLTLIMSYDMGAAKYRYSCKVKDIIRQIETSNEAVVQVSFVANKYEPSDIFGFGQYDFIQGWVADEKPVCGKKVALFYDNVQ